MSISTPRREDKRANPVNMLQDERFHMFFCLNMFVPKQKHLPQFAIVSVVPIELPAGHAQGQQPTNIVDKHRSLDNLTLALPVGFLRWFVFFPTKVLGRIPWSLYKPNSFKWTMCNQGQPQYYDEFAQEAHKNTVL